MTVHNNITARASTSEQLRRLPAAQRDALLVSAAVAAETDYLNDPELTAFEAFDKDDRNGDDAAPGAR